MAKTPTNVRSLDPKAAAEADAHNERARPSGRIDKKFADLTQSEKDDLLRQVGVRLGLITE